MGLLSKVTDFLSGSLFKEIKEGFMSYFPPDMPPQQKAEIELKFQQFLHKKEIEANRFLEESARQLDKRIAEQEGTASDLKSMPFLGTFILFLRGLQRPVWGFATLYMDNRWFFGADVFTEKQESALIIINLLVLGFLFGERAVKNLEPLIIRLFAKKAG